MNEISRVFGWFSFSHWRSFQLGLFACPDWFAHGCEQDDDLDKAECWPITTWLTQIRARTINSSRECGADHVVRSSP